MDMVKMGSFLAELRKENKLTQSKNVWFIWAFKVVVNTPGVHR